MKKALDVAKWFLAKNRSEAKECKDNYLTPMQLQKLLYFAQGYFLGCYNKPMFSDDIKAWEYGPVIPDVYNAFSAFGGKGIDVLCSIKAGDFTKEELRTLEIVYDKYSQYSGIKLSQITHEAGSPWSVTKRNETITLDKMRDYYEDYMLSEGEENELRELEKKADNMPKLIYSRERYA